MSAYVAYRSRKLQTPRKLIEEIDSAPEPVPLCPESSFKMFLRIREANVNDNISRHSGVKVGTSPAMKTEGSKYVPVNINSIDSNRKKVHETNFTNSVTGSHSMVGIPPLVMASPSITGIMSLRKREMAAARLPSTSNVAQLLQSNTSRHIILTPSSSGTTMVTPTGQRLTVVSSSISAQQQQNSRNGRLPITKPVMKVSPIIATNSSHASSSLSATVMTTLASSSSSLTPTLQKSQLTASLAHQLKAHSYAAAINSSQERPIANNVTVEDEPDSEFTIVETEEMIRERRKQKLLFLAKLNRRKCDATPIYGNDLRDTVQNLLSSPVPDERLSWNIRGFLNCTNASCSEENWSLNHCIKSYAQRTEELKYFFENFVLFVPKVTAPTPYLHYAHPHPSRLNEEQKREVVYAQEISPKLAIFHPIISAMSTQFPDPRLIQYDCGKLQTLDRLLRQLKCGQHRVLIFTQMTRMLDVLEAFLNYHGHIYLRLDGSTRIEQRQILMDRFNNDKRIFAFILSTRSGGVGINLTGADTVIFYDSDWNPTMDAQAQDRCHRIGQTRDVNIYRLVSEKTIEENILKKANQKRLLGDLAIEGGNFTTAYFKSSSIQDLFNVNSNEDDASTRLSEVLERDKDRRKVLQDNLLSGPSTSTATASDDRSAMGAFESALAEAEDEQDVQAAKIASAEADADLAEFDESIPIEENENKPPEKSKEEQEVENLVKQVMKN